MGDSRFRRFIDLSLPATLAGAVLFAAATAAVAQLPESADRTATAWVGFEPSPMAGASSQTIDAALIWRSARVSSATGGPVRVSLTPADPALAPFIWLPGSGETRAIELAAVDAAAPAQRARTIELGAFEDGLAPALVRFEGEGKAASQLWGYVNDRGQWVIPPRYADAGSFVGDVAVVLDAAGLPRLIDRGGAELPWEPVPLQQFAGRRYTVEAIKLERLGRFTHVRQTGSWSEIRSADNRQVAGVPSHLSDGKQVLLVPGVDAQVSPDGELWAIKTPEGSRLWSPAGGFIETPPGAEPMLALASNLYTRPSRDGTGNAIIALPGRVVLEDAGHIQMALTPQRFASCLNVLSPSTLDMHSADRSIRGDLGAHRCGIRDAQGRWWVAAQYQTIDRIGEHQVLLQDSGAACLADLRDDPMVCAETGAPLPVLATAGTVPHLYRYRSADGKPAWDGEYTWAWPFAGNVAQAMSGGIQGLVDRQGRWLTPRPQGTPLERAHQAAAVMQRPNSERHQGWGLIDRQGRFVVPPVWGQLGWLADGSVRACAFGAGFLDRACERLATDGRVLPSDPASARMMNPPPAAAGNAAKVAPASLTTAPALEPVGRNGRWGYQDAKGRWVIQPAFDDAGFFDGERAPAALLGESESAGMPPSMLWGLIDRAGQWVTRPQFDAIRRFEGPVAVATKEVLFGLIDGDGNWLAQPEFKSIGRFESGRATAERGDRTFCQLRTDGACGGPKGLTSIVQGADRWALATFHDTKTHRTTFGFLDADWQWAIEPRFAQASLFVGDTAMALAELPPPDPTWPTRWITVDVKRHPHAGLVRVSAVHPAGPVPFRTQPPAPLQALADDQGHWLLPRRRP